MAITGIVRAMNGSSPAFSLPPTYGFEELAQYEEARRRDLAGRVKNELAERRKKLASSLTDQGRGLFESANPLLLEDLNRRGLFTSPTAVANEQTRALKEIELQNQGVLNEFDTAATAAGLQGEQDALDSALELRRAQLEGSLADAQSAREQAFAQDLAEQQRKQSLVQSLIGAGGNIFGASLLSGGGSGGGGGLLSGLTGGGATPLGRLFGGGASGASGAGPGGIPLASAGKAPGLGIGSMAAGLGAGFLGSKLGRNTFGGGNDAGSVVGGGLGYMMGGPLGAGVGSFLGTGAQRLGEQAYEQTQNKVGNTAASVIKPFVDPVGSVKSVAKSIKKAFCFDAMTPIEMKDGSVKPICEMDLGDETKGGIVESIRVSRTDAGTRYLYKGVEVTGSHAVRENDRWIRVENSEFAEPLKGSGIVFSLVTSDHRIFVDGIEFADEAETDEPEQFTIDESLSILNALVGVA